MMFICLVVLSVDEEVGKRSNVDASAGSHQVV